MRIIYSKHALQRMRRRAISARDVETAIEQPARLYYDATADTIVAIKDNLVVAYHREDEDKRVVTLFRVTDVNHSKGVG